MTLREKLKLYLYQATVEHGSDMGPNTGWKIHFFLK